MDSYVCEELDRAAKVISGADGVALACHVTPDGDALGSMIGFLHLSRAAGLTAVASWPAPHTVASCYRSVPGVSLAVPAARFPREPAVMLTFDCGSLGRLKELRAPAEHARDHGELIVLDHHATNERYGTVNPIDTNAAATAVVVRQLAQRLKWPLTRDAAFCLYTGLVTDTGRFRYASTDASVFALAEELASFDLPIASLSRELFEEHRFSYLQLAARALSRAQLDASRRFVWTSVTQADLREFGVGYDEIEGLIDWVRTTAEAEVAAVLKEADDGVRVSLRALSEVDVGSVAGRLGGGGHRLAAGFTIDAPIDEVLVRLTRELDRELECVGDVGVGGVGVGGVGVGGVAGRPIAGPGPSRLVGSPMASRDASAV